MFDYLSAHPVAAWAGVVLVVVVVLLWWFFGRSKQDGTGQSGQADSSDRKVDGQLGGQPQWDSADPTGSLTKVLVSVETAARSATNWYWREKIGKSRWSRVIQFSAIILTSLAGLWPIMVGLVRESQPAAPPWLTSGLWSSAFVGTAAALLAIDRFFGFSTAWARFVLAATEIQRRLAEFRMDWLALSAAMVPQGGSAPQPPSPEQIAALLQKAKEFRMSVENVVVQETKEWATEFQSNMAQLEKDVKAQLEALKTQVEQQQKAKETASQPGSIEVTVSNADKTVGFAFTVDLDGPNGSVAHGVKKVNSFTWAQANVPPGTYTLTITGDMPPATPPRPTNTMSQTTIVVVKSDETAKPSVTLPI